MPDNREAVKTGAAYFQHHCQICHGLDGHNTGVPFADRMSPPITNLGDEDTQDYKDGQLKWIIQNGIRFTGMPGWEGILDDDEMWYMVRFLRHLPAKGSLGVPAVFKEAEEHHEMVKGKKAPRRRGQSGEQKSHTHTHNDRHEHLRNSYCKWGFTRECRIPVPSTTG